MTVRELQAFKVDLLDEINILATEPVPNTEEIKQKVDELFLKLEAVIGQEEASGTTAR